MQKYCWFGKHPLITKAKTSFMHTFPINITLNPCHAEYLMNFTPPKFYSINLQHSSCKHVFSIRAENGVDLLSHNSPWSLGYLVKPTVESAQGNYFSPLFRQRDMALREYQPWTNTALSGYPFIHLGEEEQTWDEFSAQKNPTVWAGFEPGTSWSRVLSLTTRPPSDLDLVFKKILAQQDKGSSKILCILQCNG